VASIVSPSWDKEDARDRAGEAERVLALLGVREGTRVADIGAGSGYYTVRLSRRVGAGGRVYAQDIVPRYLSDLGERVRRERLENVTLALGEPHDPRLPARSVDLALLVHMYHEIEQPFALLYNLQAALRPGARVAVLDLERPTTSHGTPPALLDCEMAAVGYRRTESHDLGGSGYLAVFAAPERRTLPTAADVSRCRAD
jgi:ubiquinone/menaquinone biosynthesis C-methylase UbiE